MLKFLGAFVVMFLPWPLKRICYSVFYGYQVSGSARVGMSLICCEDVFLGDRVKIGHFNFIFNLHKLSLEEHAIIAKFNWISGYLSGKNFNNKSERRSELRMGRHSAITNRHIVDCTDVVSIGDFSTVAGYRSQILTHQIDFSKNCQDCSPVHIGEYSFVGTNCVLLMGAVLPEKSILAPNSTLNSMQNEPFVLYAGSPAAAKKDLNKKYKYFTRTVGYVK